MADILPINPILDDKQEYTPVSVTFVAQLAALETLVSLNITDSRPNDGISIDGSSYRGEYRDSFSLASDALTVRMKVDKDGNPDIRTYDSWSKLPPPKDADIIEWKAPASLATDYWYEVTMVYSIQTDPPSPVPTEKTITKRYTQTVFGDYNVWANQLRQYVKDSE